MKSAPLAGGAGETDENEDYGEDTSDLSRVQALLPDPGGRPQPPGRFSRVPPRAAKDPSISRLALRVLIAVCAYSSPEGVAFPSQEKLRERTGADRSDVSRAIHRLRRLGYVELLPPQRLPNGRFRHNVYRVISDEEAGK